MRLSDIQPQYFPRQHYLARVLASDVFVLRDDVQFVRTHKYPDGSRGSSYQGHTPIKTQQGELMLAVNLKKGDRLRICDVGVSYDQDWTRKHLNLIRNAYGKAPFFKEVFPELERLVLHPQPNLAQLNVATLCWALLRLLGEADLEPDHCSLRHLNEQLAARRDVRLQRVLLGTRSVDQGPDPAPTPTRRIVELCLHTGADEYLAGGTAAQSYLELEEFAQAGVKLELQDWACTPYPQRFPDIEFVRNLSVIDLLMNVDPIEALRRLSTRGD